MPGIPVDMDRRYEGPYSPMMNEAAQYAHAGVEPGVPPNYNNLYPREHCVLDPHGPGYEHDPRHPMAGLTVDERVRRYVVWNAYITNRN